MIDWGLMFVASAIALAAAYAASLRLSPALFSGTPTFCIVLSVCVQLVILPPITLWAWRDGVAAVGSTPGWLAAPWIAAPRVWEHHFVVAIVASMVKDMPWLFKFRHEPPHMGNLLIAHHVSCVALMLYGLASEPMAFSMFIVATMALEFGSACNSLAELNPRSSFFVWGYIAVMTASNVVGVSVMVWMLTYASWTPWMITTVVVGLVTIYFRQVVTGDMRDKFVQTGCAV